MILTEISLDFKTVGQGVTSRLLLISLNVTDQTKYRLKAQYVGLKGLYQQKWAMIFRIIFSLVYNHLKLWIIVFSLIKNEMFISTEEESNQWPFTVLQQKKKILWGQKSSFPTGDHYQRHVCKTVDTSNGKQGQLWHFLWLIFDPSGLYREAWEILNVHRQSVNSQEGNSSCRPRKLCGRQAEESPSLFTIYLSYINLWVHQPRMDSPNTGCKGGISHF